MSFYSETPIKSVRKARPCCACGKPLEVGQPALKCSGNHDGFWSGTYHVDCRAAELALNNLHGCYGGEDWINIGYDLDWEDWPWLVEEFPAVAARMNVTVERHDQIRDKQARCRQAFAFKVERGDHRTQSGEMEGGQ